MKIAVVSIYPQKASKHVKASGVASYAKNLLKNIPLQPEDELFVICEKLDGVSETYQEDGITVVRAFDRNANFLRQIYAAAREINPDVVHIQQEVPLYGGIHTAYMLQHLARMLKRYNVVITFHHVVNLRIVDKKFVRDNGSKLPVRAIKTAFKVVYKPLVKQASRMIVHEQYFKQLLVDQYGANANKVDVIPHGVEDFTPVDMQTARQKLDIPAGKHVVLFMGYLAGYKGFDLLIEGFAEYVKRDPDAYLVIGAGKHPKFENDQTYLQDYAAKQAKAEKLIGAGNYRWIGFIDEKDIADYYSAADVSLYPYTISMSSSGPMSFAMGYEKPFLASDVFKDVLPPNVLFDRTPEALAGKLEDFFKNIKSYGQLSKTMKQSRLWGTVGQLTMDTYKETIK
ncbi:MAG TPA: glycosyltransferase [Candidatus Saccharimonadales bacterium]|nr:glycosyltransferase [Candidatus Saccharimonadales bacterium]